MKCIGILLVCLSLYHVCAVPTMVRSRNQSLWDLDSLEKQIMLLITEPALQHRETYFEGGKKSLNLYSGLPLTNPHG